LGDLDGVRIPARLLKEAKGVAVLTVVKGGFGLAGVEFGTGLVVARLGERWSAPSAIGTAGLSWGGTLLYFWGKICGSQCVMLTICVLSFFVALIGAQVSDHVFLLMTDSAVEMMFAHNGSLQLGADVGVALGPLGRALEADFGASVANVAPIYTYSLSKGLYAGVSLDGKVIVTRHNVNEKFYGRSVSAGELLQGVIPTPPAAQPLYDALTRCHQYAIGGRPPPQPVPSRESYEYGEYPMPPADNDQHSYAGLSDVTTTGFSTS
jgi:lipid-binding SYLF domain-containing protein